MGEFRDSSEIERALRLVGELLDAQGAHAAIVVIGGAALNLQGLVSRSTSDVDVVALGVPADLPREVARAPSRFPVWLATAIRTVARDLGLPEDWLNTGPAEQWTRGCLRGCRAGSGGMPSARCK